MEEIIRIRRISIWIFFIPVIILNICLFISVNYLIFENTIFVVDQLGRSGFTIPYIDGGVSISRTARNYPTYLIFKPGMIITAFLLIKYWFANNNMAQSINNQKETNNVLKNGWLSTGDIGHFENGYLKITDRKKDIIITPGGDHIPPVKIENDLTKNNFIEQALVYGDNKPYLIALLVLSNNNKKLKNEIIFKEIEKINKNLSKIEKIKKFFVIKEQFTIENGMMTPTLKLKRYKIIKKYKNEFEKHY